MPWYIRMEDDGEYTGPGDNPPGYTGDWYEVAEVWDGNTGETVCECENVQIAHQIIAGHAAIEALKQVEWIDGDCPWCGFPQYDNQTGDTIGHAHDCPRQAALELLGTS